MELKEMIKDRIKILEMESKDSKRLQKKYKENEFSVSKYYEGVAKAHDEEIEWLKELLEK